MSSDRKLTPKQERFVKEYLVDLNATQAAGRAGYSDPNIGRQLITKGNVQQAIAEQRKGREDRTLITGDRILLETARIAFFDPRKLFKDDGTPKGIHELDDDSAACIGGLKVVTKGNAEMGFGEVLEYKINEKNSALEKLFKHQGLYEQDNKQKTDPAAILGALATTELLRMRDALLKSSGGSGKGDK